MATGTTWKESKVNKKKIKPELIKPFDIKHFRFFPCNYQKNTRKGFVYYLAIRNHKGILILENNSPMFKSREECLEFTKRIHFPFVIG